MKKILKCREGTREDFHHIDFLRICAFASEDINFTKQESAHFDLCRVCRLKVIAELRKLAAKALLCRRLPDAVESIGGVSMPVSVFSGESFPLTLEITCLCILANTPTKRLVTSR
jgi:hypothetical protein